MVVGAVPLAGMEAVVLKEEALETVNPQPLLFLVPGLGVG